MGVDFYGCSVCGESRYEEYIGWCTQCGTPICTACVVNDDINSKYAYEYGLKYDSSKPELMKKYADEGWDIYDPQGKPYYEDGDKIDDSSIAPHYCPYCNGSEINKEQLYDFIISKYNIDENKEWNEYKQQK